jgi:hypothetical protein
VMSEQNSAFSLPKIIANLEKSCIWKTARRVHGAICTRDSLFAAASLDICRETEMYYSYRWSGLLHGTKSERARVIRRVGTYSDKHVQANS